MVQNIICLLASLVNNGLVPHRNDLNPFNPHVTQARVCFYGGDHVGDFLQTLTERVKLPKDIVLAIMSRMKNINAQKYQTCQ